MNPSVEEVRAYIAEKGYHFSAEEIVRYYTTDGEKKVWKFSNGSLVRDWKRCCVTFEQRHLERYGNQPARASGSISSARSNDDYYQRVKESEEEYYKRMEEEIRNGTARNLF